MEGMVVLFIIFAICLGIGIRLLAGQLNHGRIRQYIENRGGQVSLV